MQDALDDDAHVISYDPAGLGWSDPTNGAVDLTRTVGDLHAALAAVEAPEPYVMGGHIALLYAHTHPEAGRWRRAPRPSHEDQFVGAPELDAQLDQADLMGRLPWKVDLAQNSVSSEPHSTASAPSAGKTAPTLTQPN